MTRRRLFVSVSGVAAVAGLVAATALGVFTHAGSVASGAARSEGVQVHGHWTIVVRSRSGKVVSRHNFHNDFVGAGLGTSGGSHAFAKILSGGGAPGAWDVSIQGTACPASNAGFCQMFEPDATPSFFVFPPDTKNLTVTEPTSGTDAFKIVLASSVSATSDGTITRVSTGLQACAASATVGHDCGIGYNEITDRTLPTPISVLSGQIISVTVKISFA